MAKKTRPLEIASAALGICRQIDAGTSQMLAHASAMDAEREMCRKAAMGSEAGKMGAMARKGVRCDLHGVQWVLACEDSNECPICKIAACVSAANQSGLGEVRHDFDAIVNSSELCNLRTLPDMPQDGSV